MIQSYATLKTPLYKISRTLRIIKKGQISPGLSLGHLGKAKDYLQRVRGHGICGHVCPLVYFLILLH